MTEQLGTTPSQTVGPYLAIGLPWADGADAVVEGTPDAIEIHGVMTDGAGDPVPDGIVETWQADPDGRFGSDSAGFRGFARACTDADGRFWFRTVVPGAVDGQAPHIDVNVFARGLLRHLVTRIYFPDQPANAEDPVLTSLDTSVRARLVAVPDGDGRLRFDVRLQGDGETPYFAV